MAEKDSASDFGSENSCGSIKWSSANNSSNEFWRGVPCIRNNNNNNEGAFPESEKNVLRS